MPGRCQRGLLHAFKHVTLVGERRHSAEVGKWGPGRDQALDSGVWTRNAIALQGRQDHWVFPEGFSEEVRCEPSPEEWHRFGKHLWEGQSTSQEVGVQILTLGLDGMVDLSWPAVSSVVGKENCPCPRHICYMLCLVALISLFAVFSFPECKLFQKGRIVLVIPVFPGLVKSPAHSRCY